METLLFCLNFPADKTGGTFFNSNTVTVSLSFYMYTIASSVTVTIPFAVFNIMGSFLVRMVLFSFGVRWAFCIKWKEAPLSNKYREPFGREDMRTM